VTAILSKQAEAAFAEPGCDALSEAATGSGTISRRGAPVTLNAISQRAYAKWVAAGQPEGDGSRFWLQAEEELLQGNGRD
jgi:hypothetical protein